MSEEFVPKSAWHYWHNRLWSEIAKICTDYAEWKPGRLPLHTYSVTAVKQHTLAVIGVVIPIESECFACAASDCCRTCPVVWTPTSTVSKYDCNDSRSAFNEFARHFRARMYIEAANAAEAVANLPWIVEREANACPLPMPKEVKNG